MARKAPGHFSFLGANLIRKIQARNAITRDGFYATIPNEIWSRKELSSSAIRIWGYLMSQGANWHSSRNNVSRNLGLSPNTVSKCLKTLQALNMLRVDQRGRGALSFDIIEPSQWINSDPVRKRERITSDPPLDQKRSGSGSETDPQTRRQKNNKNAQPSEPFERGSRSALLKSQEAALLRMVEERIEKEANKVQGELGGGLNGPIQRWTTSNQNSDGTNRKSEASPTRISETLRFPGFTQHWRGLPGQAVYHR